MVAPKLPIMVGIATLTMDVSTTSKREAMPAVMTIIKAARDIPLSSAI
jgi:hypothetical protein